jgi:hypothetical protein
VHANWQVFVLGSNKKKRREVLFSHKGKKEIKFKFPTVSG